jgi:hypothetical protein
MLDFLDHCEVVGGKPCAFPVAISVATFQCPPGLKKAASMIPTPLVARQAVAHQMGPWEKKVGMTVRPAQNIADATIHAQIRDRLAAIKDKMPFLEKNAADPVIASAILTAPFRCRAMISAPSTTSLPINRNSS